MYQLYFNGDDRVDPHEFTTLADAMVSIGWIDPADWMFAHGTPDAIYSRNNWTFDQSYHVSATCWVIEAPGVAHELIGLLPAASLIGRCWYAEHAELRGAVTARLPCAAPDAFAAGARLTAHYTVAGHLTWQELVEAASAGLPAGHDAGEYISDLARQLLAVVASEGIPVVPASPSPARLAVASTGPGKPVYFVRRYHSDTPDLWGPPIAACNTLTGAMQASGLYRDFSDWDIAPGQPDTLFSADDSLPFYVLEAPGVAREYARACPAATRSARDWSYWDDAIIQAVLTVARDTSSGWRLAVPQTHEVATLLAALCATGPFGWSDVYQSIYGAYRASYDGDPDQPAARLTDQITTLMAAAGVPIDPPAPELAAPELAPLPGAGRPPLPELQEMACGAITSDRLLTRLQKPVWVVPVPAGRLPRWLCRTLSRLISTAIGAVTFVGGLLATCALAGGPVTFGTWWVFGWGSMLHWSSWTAWWNLNVLYGTVPDALAFLVTWYLAACVAEKLIYLELRPTQQRKAAASD